LPQLAHFKSSLTLQNRTKRLYKGNGKKNKLKNRFI